LILYLDTSALVKLYSDEAGSIEVRNAVGNADLIATSALAYAEMRSALARKARAGEIRATELKKCRRDFERDWVRINRLAVDEVLIRKAGDYCEEHALRAFDAIHLATAESLQSVLRAAVTFACFDGALNGAAHARGLKPLRQSQS
jgi:uncharacterized protein